MKVVRLTYEIPVEDGRTDDAAIVVARHKMNFGHPRPKAVSVKVVEIPETPEEFKTRPEFCPTT